MQLAISEPAARVQPTPGSSAHRRVDVRCAGSSALTFVTSHLALDERSLATLSTRSSTKTRTSTTLDVSRVPSSCTRRVTRRPTITRSQQRGLLCTTILKRCVHSALLLTDGSRALQRITPCSTTTLPARAVLPKRVHVPGWATQVVPRALFNLYYVQQYRHLATSRQRLVSNAPSATAASVTDAPSVSGAHTQVSTSP